MSTSEQTMSSEVLLLVASMALATCVPLDQERDEALRRQRQEREEAAAAQYHFASNVQDGISDLTQVREEIRNGLNVRGYYSYSDGHYKRKVSYEADEKGYRIVGEEVQPLKGPQVNPEGKASVHTMAHGNEVVYSVIGDDKTRHRLHDKQQDQRAFQPLRN